MLSLHQCGLVIMVFWKKKRKKEEETDIMWSVENEKKLKKILEDLAGC